MMTMWDIGYTRMRTPGGRGPDCGPHTSHEDNAGTIPSITWWTRAQTCTWTWRLDTQDGMPFYPWLHVDQLAWLAASPVPHPPVMGRGHGGLAGRLTAHPFFIFILLISRCSLPPLVVLGRDLRRLLGCDSRRLLHYLPLDEL